MRIPIEPTDCCIIRPRPPPPAGAASSKPGAPAPSCCARALPAAGPSRRPEHADKKEKVSANKLFFLVRSPAWEVWVPAPPLPPYSSRERADKKEGGAKSSSFPVRPAPSCCAPCRLPARAAALSMRTRKTSFLRTKLFFLSTRSRGKCGSQSHPQPPILLTRASGQIIQQFEDP